MTSPAGLAYETELGYSVSTMQLHDAQGKRLYLTADERRTFIAAAAKAERPVRTFCAVLHDTGCRISEALALTPERIDLTGRAIVFESLKKRRRGVYRVVPVPSGLLDTLDMVHGLREAQQRGKGLSDRLLWDWSRVTAWRRVGAVMDAAGIPAGPHRSPEGLRHGYGVHAISSGVPLNMLSKWMGHATLEVTAIYANALGAEEQGIAARMWGG
jgi:integrase/recombinase XerD